MQQQRDFHATINIVTWNSEEYIEDLLKSLEAQTFLGFHIIVIDNASSDKTLEIIGQHKNITLIKNSSNIGFSRAHNKGIEMALKFWQGKDLSDRSIVVLNPDVVLKENCLEELLKSIYRNQDVAIMGPKLLRIYEEEIDNLSHKSKSNIVDSLGIEIFKSRKTIDIFSGQEDPRTLKMQEVFGMSGAFMCIRANALDAIKYKKEYFDENFFAYKEDIDLCWRFRNLGWKIMINPEAVAYHYRRVRGGIKRSVLERFNNQKNKPQIIKFLSTRNHLWTIWKNDFLNNFIVHLPFIIFRELGKLSYVLFFDVKTIKAYFSAILGLPKILQKRKYLKNAKIAPKEIREWMR